MRLEDNLINLFYIGVTSRVVANPWVLRLIHKYDAIYGAISDKVL